MDEKEKIKNIASKDPLEQALLKGQGISGLKADEKRVFLGQYRERVIIALSTDQVEHPGTYPEVNEAIKHPRASKLILNRHADLDKASEYIELARKESIEFTTISSMQKDTHIGLIVAADNAVDIEDVFVEDLGDRFKKAGLDPKLLNFIGHKVCRKCYNKIKEKTPDLLHLFEQSTFLDKITGSEKCC
ncbi:YueI family protein [Proteinivorax hydrogeniformans]|uniref:YueI family protein n=1 Tax=Proteinivorax hydrogeniformans TaxID=1826727 RepID=A0AAU8HSP1_9FIRM